MYGNVDTVLLWIRLLDNYLVHKCKLKRSRSDSYIFFNKYTKGIVIIKPNFLKTVMFCDYNYATDMETINSVRCLVATLSGKLLTFLSKTQRTVTLSIMK